MNKKDQELDRILKEKLREKIKASPEFELSVIRRVEKEKQKAIEAKANTQFKKLSVEEISNNEKFNGRKRYNNFSKILSIAAVIIIVFTLGINLKNTPLTGEKSTSNLVSISLIEPTKLESGVLANNSEFIIKADGDNLNTEAIQKSIYVEPALEYTIEKTLNKNEYKLKFKQNIPDNTLLKLQYVKNQITQNSWAYQTSSKLSVTSTYPDNNSQDVSKKSIIDIEFSYANVENFEKFVNITPHVDGKWKHLGGIWRFTPKFGLKDKQRYTVKINKGIKAGKEELKDNYIFSFYVGDSANEVYIRQSTITADKIITIKPDELAKIYYNDERKDKENIGKIEIAKFANINDFVNYLENDDYKNATKQGEYEVKKSFTGEYSEYCIEPQTKLKSGYYIAKIKDKNGKQLFNCPIQVCDISAYAMETERDVLVWVANGNELAKNISVEYLGKTVKTDNQGIAKFEEIADGSENIKYAKVNNELVIGIYNFSLDEYPQGYIYTDRPLYKNTDTINIWGFVPRKLYHDKIDEEFYIQLADEEKQKVNVDDNGNFMYKIELKNHLNKETTICLYYKDSIIAQRSILIENYELQNYIYETIIDKKYAKAGDTIEFDVRVKHITGLNVPNKNVTIYKGENIVDTQKTGDDGIAHFKMKLDEAEEEIDTSIGYQEIAICNGDENEYTKAETYIYIAVLGRNTYTETLEDGSNNKYKIKIYKLEDTRNTDVSWDMHELYNGTYETKVDINLVEESRKKHIVGYTYDEYTKKNEPEYEYEDLEDKRTNLKTVTSKNGIAEISNNEIKVKNDTEEIDYSYYIEFKYKDLSGKKVKQIMYYSNDSSKYNIDGFFYTNDGVENENSSDRIYEMYIKGAYYLDRKYYSYRYLLKGKYANDDGYEFKNYTVGDKMEFTLAQSEKGTIKEIKNDGKLLTISFKENIYETNILTESNFSREYTKKDFPGFKMTSAYFLNGKFYRMPVQYFKTDEESRKVDIEITSDKEEYKPGDTVTLSIKTTNKGNPVKTNVNISVANEAVFEIEDDQKNIIETIYENKGYAAYTYSSYLDLLVAPIEGGAGGGGGSIRAKFADTAYFNMISTNRNGEAKVSFKLPDNVTTYRITTHAVNEDLYLGVNTKNIASKLDFFVQSVEPRGVKASDDLVLNATSIADKKYEVNYEFNIKELNKTLTAKGTSNNLVTVNFGKLPIGTYHAVIKGKYGEQEDIIEYEFKIVETVQEISKKTTMNLQNSLSITPSKNPIVLEIYHKNMTKYAEYIEFIEKTQTERLDTQIAFNKAQEIKEKYYGIPSSINQIYMYLYKDSKYLKNLRNGKEDILLSALTMYYAKEEYGYEDDELNDKDNIFEYYLFLAAQGKPVLNDLIHLKEEKEISNYGKLLVTLALEFVGDYSNAMDLYLPISLSEEEKEKYQSICAIIETFIKKQDATEKIDKLIKNKPEDEYLRFAILSYFKNNPNEIGKEETVKIKLGDKEEIVVLNEMQIKTLTLNNEELKNINFETNSENLVVSYYYQTLLDNIDDKEIKKDIKITGSGELKKGNIVNLKLEFDGKYEGEVRIALPNSLRLDRSFKEYLDSDKIEEKFYIQNNSIDYITLYKSKNCKTINIPLLVINEGNYKLESVVSRINGIYHISNSLSLNIEK